MYGAASFWTSISQPFVDLWNKIINAGPKWLVALAIMLIAWLMAKLARNIIKKSIGRTSTQGHVDILIARIVSGIILGIAVILALGEVGISLTGLLTALGLVSVAIGFALREVLSNLFAGIILLLQHPFTIGDQVMIGNEEGRVENVRISDTQVLTYEGERVFVPNRMVFTSPIINYTSTPAQRIDVRAGICSADDIDMARRLIKEVLESVTGILDQPEPVVLMETNPGSLVLVARFWMESDRNRSKKIESDVLELIIKSFNSAGVATPYSMKTDDMGADQAEFLKGDVTKTRMMDPIPPDVD